MHYRLRVEWGGGVVLLWRGHLFCHFGSTGVIFSRQICPFLSKAASAQGHSLRLRCSRSLFNHYFNGPPGRLHGRLWPSDARCDHVSGLRYAVNSILIGKRVGKTTLHPACKTTLHPVLRYLATWTFGDARDYSQ